MTSRSSGTGFVEIPPEKRNCEPRKPVTASTFLSMHSNDTLVFEDSDSYDSFACCSLSDGDHSSKQDEAIDPTKTLNNNNNNDKVHGDDMNIAEQPIHGKTTPARMTPTSASSLALKRERHTRRRRDLDAKGDGAWFTLSAAPTIGVLSSIHSTTKMGNRSKSRTRPTAKAGATATATMTESEKSAREKESAINGKLQALPDKNERSNAIPANTQTRSNPIAKKPQRPSVPKMSETEKKARERELALVRKLQGFLHAKKETQQQVDDGSESLIHKSSKDKSTATGDEKTKPAATHKQKPVFVSSVPSMTKKEVEARKMAELLERKLQSMQCQDGNDNAVTSRPRFSKAVSFQEDVIATTAETTTFKAPHKIWVPSVRKDNSNLERNSETHDRKTPQKRNHEALVLGRDKNKEKIIGARHRNTKKEETAHSILIDQEQEGEVSGHSSTEESRVRHKNSPGGHQLQARPTDGNCEENKNPNIHHPQQQIRDDEVIRSSSDIFSAAGDDYGREKPKERDQNQKAEPESRESLVEKGLKRYKAIVAAGAHETDSLVLRCLNEVRFDYGDVSNHRTKHRHDSELPTEIVILKEYSSSSNNITSTKSTIRSSSDSSNIKTFKPSSRVKNVAQDSNELCGVNENEKHRETSSEKDLSEFESFPDAAPIEEFESFPDAAPIARSRDPKSILRNKRKKSRSRKSDVSPAERKRKNRVSFPPALPLDLESGIKDDREDEDRMEPLYLDHEAIQRSETLAEAAKRQERMTNRMMIVISIILCVAFLIILFVIVDPLRRLI